MDSTVVPSRFEGAARRLLILTSALCLVAPANAMGLGEPLAAPVAGQPLRVEIPLFLGPGEALPRLECVRLHPVGNATDPQFFPRNARVAIHAADRTLVRIASSEAVTEPMLEFRVSLGCDSIVARDFLLLADAPRDPRLEAAPPRKTADVRTDISIEAAIKPVAPNRSPSPVAVVQGGVMRLATASSLNALARARYPDSLPMRDEFRRLMAEANPDVFSGVKHVGAVALKANTLLVVPPQLPGEARGLATPQAVASVRTSGLVKVAATLDSIAPASVTPRAARPDRLMVGAPAVRQPAAMSAREVAGAIDRIERMVEDQGRTELELVGSLDTVNNAFVEMKDFVQMLDSDQRQLQRAQKALESRFEKLPEPKSLGLLDLLGLILVSGGIGAGLITLHHGLHVRRMAGVTPTEAEPAPAPRWVVPTKGSLDFV